MDLLLRSAADADAADADVGEHAVGVPALARSRDVKLSRRLTSAELRADSKVGGRRKKQVDTGRR